MAKEFKVHNNEDKTIFAVKVEKTSKQKKLKPAALFFVILLILAALGVSIYIGYVLHIFVK
ncbi:MAG: hypothetical protein KBT21_09880 [Treponema sp.]|nr:hypothetical protein [Candidatus Treponema merdequi]